MSEWVASRLGTMIKTNQRTLTKGYPYSDILYLDTGSITRGRVDALQPLSLEAAPSRAKRLVQKNDIIYSAVRPIQRHYGFIQNPQENLVVSTGFVVITCDDEKLNPRFLYHYLSADNQVEELDMLADASTSTYPSLRPEDIESLNISLPKDVQEQTSIADVLDSLDGKIDLLHRQNKTLEDMAGVLFKQWFVVASNPRWGEKSLSDVAEFLNGLACQRLLPENEVERLPVLKIRELSDGVTENSDWATSKVKAAYIVEAGDVIFSWSASLIVKIWDGVKCVLNQHLFKVTSADYPKWYYYLWCKHHLAEFQAKAEAHATTMGHIKRGDLDEAKVWLPSPHELQGMSEIVTPIIEKIIFNSKQIHLLQTKRAVLLPKLLSGEVRVRA